MAAISVRAAAVRAAGPLVAEPSSASGLAPGAASATAPSVGLRRIRPLGLPVAEGPPARRLVKRLSRRLTAWQIDPVITQVNRLHRAAADAVEAVSER
jgi:hypothetical protein